MVGFQQATGGVGVTLSPTDVHERLDRRGLLDAARGPGTYALQVKTPDDTDAVAAAFEGVSDVSPPEPTLSRLTADAVCYVGASGHVYDRLQDHAEGAVRQALFLSAFAPVSVVGVWPADNPFAEEYNRAVALSRDGWTCWQDGEVI